MENKIMKEMKIEILNKEEVSELFEHWGTFASVCYDTPRKYAKKIGEHCLEAGHFSGSRTRYIEVMVEGVPRSMVDQVVRHEQGVVKNVQSWRYVDKTNMTYSVSKGIQGNKKAYELYAAHMEKSKEVYNELVTELIEEYTAKGMDEKHIKEKAREQARGILPIDTNTAFAIGFTVEALIHFLNKRLCVRSQGYVREFAEGLRKEVVGILPELASELGAHCENLLWCPEGVKGCGRFPTKEELKQKINEGGK